VKRRASIVTPLLFVFGCTLSLTRADAAIEPYQIASIHGPALVTSQIAVGAVLRFARTGKPFNRVNRDKHGRRRICKCKTTGRDYFFKHPDPAIQTIDVVLRGNAAPVTFHETPEGPDLSVKEFAIVVTPAVGAPARSGRPMNIRLYLRDDTTNNHRMRRLSPPPQLLDAMTRT
jgi:hypothetical protein